MIEAVQYPISNIRQGDAPWKESMGNNHRFIRTDEQIGGAVSFADHLEKPLSNKLWDDLFHRMCLRSCRIYRWGHDEEWTINWGNASVKIYLNDDDNVMDIEVTP